MDPRVIKIMNTLEDASDTAAHLIREGLDAYLQAKWDGKYSDLDLARRAAEDMAEWCKDVLRALDAAAGTPRPFGRRRADQPHHPGAASAR